MRWNSLVSRMTVFSVGIVLAATLVGAVSSYLQAKSVLEDVHRRQVKVLMTSMEATAGDPLIYSNYAVLVHFVTVLAEKEPFVAFAAVTREDGILIAHSDHSLEGSIIERFASKNNTAASEQDIFYQGKWVSEITAPVIIGGHRYGTVLLGVNYREAYAGLHRLVIGFALAGLGVLVFSFIGIRALTGKVTSGLTQLVDTTQAITGGEIRIQLPEKGYDEIRSLAHAFNLMTENLRSVLRQIQEMGSHIGKIFSDMLAVIQEQASSAAQQAASVSEVTATMEEQNRTSHQIAANAGSVKNVAAKTVEMAQQGTVLVREGVEAVSQIKDRVGDIARKTLFLGEKSHEIEKVMDIIKEIAREIHLLALNAAIESAAAGEHGRRFAVVASEVRRLADKTKESTETIRQLISEIQSATNSSIQATEQGTRDVDRWRETIKQLADAFVEIIEMIEKTSKASTQISLATQQQTSANDQVVQGMHQIDEMVRLTAGHMKELSVSATQLETMVKKFEEITAVFRL